MSTAPSEALCDKCGIGYLLPSGVCDHCNQRPAPDVKQEHKDLWARIAPLAFESASGSLTDFSHDHAAIQLIADSEARAVEAETALLRQLYASEKQAKIERGDMFCECQDALAAAKAECERLKADVTRETTVCDTACMDAQRLRAEVEKATAKIANQAERIRYLEGATNHATGTPLSLATERAERAESALALYRSKVFRMKSILSSIDDDGTEQHTSATAERAEAEVLAQAELLGRSAEREADLLGKLSRAELALANAQCPHIVSTNEGTHYCALAESTVAALTAQLAEARKDSERLDWLERNVQEVGFERMNERVLGGCSFDRDAIDAAMTNSNHKTT